MKTMKVINPMDDPRPGMQHQPVSLETWVKKYAKGDEKTMSDNFVRVANGLAKASFEHKQIPSTWLSGYKALKPNKLISTLFKQSFEDGAVCGGRIMSAAGTEIDSTLINCFVERIEDSMSGIMKALGNAAETMRRGGGEGYNFSEIRPKSAIVHGTGSTASGPVSYLHVFGSVCLTVSSAGNRRGAQMGILDISHPDIREFIHVKDELPTGPHPLKQFNLSISISTEFMEAVEANASWDLVHLAQPHKDHKPGAYQRQDEMWVYETVQASDLFNEIMESAYLTGDPGFILMDSINKDNNLDYCEVISACNPCAEEPLPPNGCCDLGSNNLARYVLDPFTENARMDFDMLRDQTRTMVRMLDNVLDVTYWPLKAQRLESESKRRIGVGFMGLGSALVMLGLRYDGKAGREMAEEIAVVMRDSAYNASVDLAIERGAFPLFDANKYLRSGFASRLPETIQARIRKHGIRNSHLLTIAPTGTIALTFGDNASNGIEPAFQWSYKRNILQDDGSKKTQPVYDYAYRVYKAMGMDTENLPESFVTALEINVDDHLKMMMAVQPYIDTSISKTINVPEYYPFEDFKKMYIKAWKGGLKSVATFRMVTGGETVFVTNDEGKQTMIEEDPNRRITLKQLPETVMNSLRFPHRIETIGGAPAWNQMVKTPNGKFFLSVTHLENGKSHPFECLVFGAEAERGIEATAKLLSLDMHAADPDWVHTKLDSLGKCQGDAPFQVTLPDGKTVTVPGTTAAIARMVKSRCEELGWVPTGDSPLMASLLSNREPKTKGQGGTAWYSDIKNPATGDDCTLFVKEVDVPSQGQRPLSVWLSGIYPKEWDGLLKVLSYDMRVVDLAWVAKKLRAIRDFPEVRGDFMAWKPGGKGMTHYPSTIAYIASLLIKRYQHLGLLDEDVQPVEDIGLLQQPLFEAQEQPSAEIVPMFAGKRCESCGVNAVIKKDGCDFCTACGEIGSCG